VARGKRCFASAMTNWHVAAVWPRTEEASNVKKKFAWTDVLRQLTL